jgi:hypothetical protein
MKLINKIREFFWPLLEKETIKSPENLDPDDIKISSDHLERTLNLSINCYENENERKKTIEGKSSLFIGTISIITSVIIGVTTVLVKSDDFKNSILLLAILLFFLTLYMARTIWFSIKALERKSYNTLTIDDFLIKEQKDQYYKKLIAEISNKMRKNSLIINTKVDYMTMAQEYFKRSIIIVVIYAFTILVLLTLRLGIEFSNVIKEWIVLINTVSITGWNLILIYSLTITSLIISMTALFRKKK